MYSAEYCLPWLAALSENFLLTVPQVLVAQLEEVTGVFEVCLITSYFQEFT
jgi:hypothetical protein